MLADNVVSLRRYRANRLYRKFLGLPISLRTPQRAEGVLSAIFDYAYEHVPIRNGRPARAASWEDTRLVSRKLVEFMPADSASDPDEMMQWLHENLVPEAWSSPEYLKDFIHECLRHG